MKPALCPNGHQLPREGCTPLYCKPPKAAKPPKVPKLMQPRAPRLTKADEKKAAAAMEKVNTELALAQADEEQVEKARAALQRRIADLEMRKRLLKMPEGLTGAAAEEYAQKKAVDLLPQAVLETEFQLLYGDDKMRRDAARDVLNMNGMLNREAGGTVSPTIILNLGGADQQLAPWLVRTDAKVTTREAPRVEEGQASPTAGDKPR